MMFIKKALVVSISVIALTALSPVTAQEMQWSIESGIGYESNIYHAPDHSYVDTALPSTRPAGIAVSPREISSLVIPLKADAEFINKFKKDADFVADLGISTSLMLDSDASDASNTNVNLNLGVDYDLTEIQYNKKKKQNMKRDLGNAYLGMFISTHNEVYVDKDSGLPKTTTGGVDISDKYSYQSYGFKGDYQRKIGGFKYVLGFEYEDLNYDTPLSGAEYDHTFQKLILGLKRKLSKATSLKFAYEYSIRDYSDRHSRDLLTGTYSIANDLLEYTYGTMKVSLGHRFNNKLKAYFDVKSTTREDGFEGYNDSSRLDLSLRARYKYSSQTKIRGKLSTTTTDYDNAFNFEDNTRGLKDSSAIKLDIKATYEMNKNKSYYLDMNVVSKDSTDDRYEYANNNLMLGANWAY